MSGPATQPAVYAIVGRCVGVLRKNGRGRWWCEVGRAQLTPYGLRLWVFAGPAFGNPRWVDATQVTTRNNRDKAVIDNALVWVKEGAAT